MTNKRPLALPSGANPLAHEVGLRLRLVREGRGLSITQAAAQLGISGGWYAHLESGKIVPGENLSKRIYRWLLEGISFEGAPPLTEKQFELQPKGWKKVGAYFSKPDRLRLQREASRLGVSMSTLINLFVRRGLANRPALATLREAVHELQLSRASQALAESPELRDVLTGEIPLMVEAGAVPTPWTQVEELKASIERIAQIPVDTLTDIRQDRQEVVELGEE